jgi:GNAT superfamily N-acetyltransferase
VRQARGSEHIAAGRVTQRAYAEFEAHFKPEDWAVYAPTLPDTSPRVRDGELLVAVSTAGEVIGTVTVYTRAVPTSGYWRVDDAMIRFLAVDPDHRGHNVGTALLEEALRRAGEAGKTRMALQTTPHMTAATRMYQRRGFTPDPDGDLTVGSFTLLGYALGIDARHRPGTPPVPT